MNRLRPARIVLMTWRLPVVHRSIKNNRDSKDRCQRYSTEIDTALGAHGARVKLYSTGFGRVDYPCVCTLTLNKLLFKRLVAAHQAPDRVADASAPDVLMAAKAEPSADPASSEPLPERRPLDSIEDDADLAPRLWVIA